ncbi:MAG: hypothetical protein WKF96_08075 [Solirubrobacteraceae bacterium]
MLPEPYERCCVCGWLHRALLALGLKDRHEYRCEVAHGVGFNAYVREQRALLQQHYGGGRYVPVSVDERDGHARRN